MTFNNQNQKVFFIIPRSLSRPQLGGGVSKRPGKCEAFFFKFHSTNSPPGASIRPHPDKITLNLKNTLGGDYSATEGEKHWRSFRRTNSILSEMVKSVREKFNIHKHQHSIIHERPTTIKTKKDFFIIPGRWVDPTLVGAYRSARGQMRSIFF